MAVTASVIPAQIFAGPMRFREVPLEAISFAAFASYLNLVFQVEAGSGATLGLQLVEVRPSEPFPAMYSAPPDAANEKFSLLFLGPLQPALEQDSYWFGHKGIGRFLIFIASIGSTETSHRYYEAIFNRPRVGPLSGAGEVDIAPGVGRNPRARLGVMGAN